MDGSRKWWVLTTMCLLSVMLNLDFTVVNLAVPVIAHASFMHGFHVSMVTCMVVAFSGVALALFFKKTHNPLKRNKYEIRFSFNALYLFTFCIANAKPRCRFTLLKQLV
ncbi:MAG: hypothetical protein H7A36_07320 [Chlamydiales bacterium]|nr:hypothetical protein [Chlamydiales bacterium]